MDTLELRMVTILHELDGIRRSVAALEYQVVQLVRDAGGSWDMIGEAMDPPISRQTAARRFSQPRGRRL